MKNSDTIGNRTRDLPTCSAVPQPTALPGAPPRHTTSDKSREIFSFKKQFHAVHRKRPARALTANSSCKLPQYSVNGSSRFTVRTQLFYSLIKTHTVQTIYLFRPKLSKIITAILTSTRTPVNKQSTDIKLIHFPLRLTHPSQSCKLFTCQPESNSSLILMFISYMSSPATAREHWPHT